MSSSFHKFVLVHPERDIFLTTSPVNVFRKTMCQISGNILFFSWLMQKLVRTNPVTGLHLTMPRYLVHF